MTSATQVLPSATLPIDCDGGLRMNSAEAHQFGQLFADDYQRAIPFPHIVLDNFLPDKIVQQVLEQFPTERIRGDHVFHMGYGGDHKRQIFPEECPEPIRNLFWFLNSQAMIQFVEGLTGIQGLLPDPYFTGAGLHETSAGGKLGIHADFRVNEDINLQRRVNLLIYLNPEWQDEWLGHLELWSRDMKTCAAKVTPLLNRCVVFSTEADTWHGHPDPLATPNGVTRRSIAMYYYTASASIRNEVQTRSTMYMARPADNQSIHQEARMFQLHEYARDWLPPVAFRLYTRIKYRLTRT
jgi:Rps23 Pro-64 3,4-dihydroxylase Tpa1-like proline 4-hydroxylase